MADTSRALDEALDQLERADPAVAEAARRLDRAVWQVGSGHAQRTRERWAAALARADSDGAS